jgi:hypothetical protein
VEVQSKTMTTILAQTGRTALAEERRCECVMRVTFPTLIDQRDKLKMTTSSGVHKKMKYFLYIFCSKCSNLGWGNAMCKFKISIGRGSCRTKARCTENGRQLYFTLTLEQWNAIFFF